MWMASLVTTLVIVLDSVGCLWSLPRVDILQCHVVKVTMTAVPLVVDTGGWSLKNAGLSAIWLAMVDHHLSLHP